MSDTECVVCGAAINNESIDRPVGTRDARTAGHADSLAPEIDPRAGTKAMHDGAWVYFDRMVCRNKFLANPAAFAKS